MEMLILSNHCIFSLCAFHDIPMSVRFTMFRCEQIIFVVAVEIANSLSSVEESMMLVF